MVCDQGMGRFAHNTLGVCAGGAQAGITTSPAVMQAKALPDSVVSPCGAWGTRFPPPGSLAGACTA